jgi:hypothetical protein
MCSLLTNVLPSCNGQEGATDLERMVYDLGHDVMNLAAVSSDVLHLQVPIRRGRWRANFTLERQDASSTSTTLQMDFFRLVNPVVTIVFPPPPPPDQLPVWAPILESGTPATVRQALQSRSSGGVDGVGGGGGGDSAGVFVFYRGVVPFLILGLTEDEGVRDKFGPSIFFLRITVFRGGDHEWEFVYAQNYFCASQVLFFSSVLRHKSNPTTLRFRILK